MDRDEILGAFELVRNSPGVLAEIGRAASVVRMQPGHFLFHAGDACSAVGFVGRGNVRVFKRGASGREITLYHVRPGETCLLTLNGALTGAIYPAEGVVEEETEAAIVSASDFRAWIDREPALRRLVYHAMARRITDLMELVDEITFGKLEQRLGEYLLAKFRDAAGPQRVLFTTHEHIAAELGSVREVISRLLKELERRGAVKLERGRLILQAERLLEESSRR